MTCDPTTWHGYLGPQCTTDDGAVAGDCAARVATAGLIYGHTMAKHSTDQDNIHGRRGRWLFCVIGMIKPVVGTTTLAP